LEEIRGGQEEKPVEEKPEEIKEPEEQKQEEDKGVIKNRIRKLIKYSLSGIIKVWKITKKTLLG
jgi:hypothetical protein